MNIKHLSVEELNLSPDVGTGFIYAIEAPSGKLYIGKTYGSVGKRFRRHCRPQRSRECPAIWRAIQKHGALNMTLYLLHVAPVSMLSELERGYIASFNTVAPFGYNLTIGGDGGDVVLTEDIRFRIGSARRGTHCTPEHKAALSVRWKGTHLSAERKASHSKKMSGRKLSDDTKLKLSVAGKARNWKPTPAHLAKMIAARHPRH